MMNSLARYLWFCLAFAVVFGGLSQRVSALEETLTPEEKARLQTYLPHSWHKLVARDHFHILAVGDSITEVRTENLHQMPSLNSYYGTLAQKIARKFFYTGEVRDIDPREWEPAKFRNDMGPEVTVQNMGLGGRYLNHGMQRIWTDALEYRPDLVTINYGVNDSGVAIPVWEWIEHMRKTVNYLRGQKIDVILLGPTHVMSPDEVRNLALTPPYGSALRDLAQELGVLYVDLGVPTWSSYFEIDDLNAEEALKQTVESAKQLYIDDKGVFDPLHPNVTGQRKMGEYIFQQLFGPPLVVNNYGLEASFYPDDAEGGKLELTLTNTTAEPHSGYVMPLPIGTATDVERTPVAYDLEPGQSITHSWNYTALPADKEVPFVLRYDLLAAHENFYRVPVLVMDRRQSQLLKVKAVQRPVGVIWKVGRTDWVEGRCNVFALLVNSSTNPVKGRWEAEWKGQQQSGEFDLAAGGNSPLQMSFELSDDPEVTHLAGDLLTTFTLDDGRTFRTRRAIELIRNITLGKTYTMNRMVRGADREIPVKEDVVEFRATATQEGLGIEFTLRNFDYSIRPGQPAVRLSLGLDAQNMEDRGKPGYYRKTFIDMPGEGDIVTTHGLQRAHFGLTYNERIKETAIQRSMTFPDENTRVINVIYPRTMFYDHEWNLGSHKSWVGFDLNVTKADHDREHIFEVEREQTWTKNGLSYPDPMGLGVLELTDEPSPYWRLLLE